MSPITLVIRQRISPLTGRHVHGYFRVYLDCRLVCFSTRQPLLDGPRALLAEGANPTSSIRMRRAGSPYDLLCSTIGAAANPTVEDPEKIRPRLACWEPFPALLAHPALFEARS